jgi:1-phosphofructokinase
VAKADPSALTRHEVDELYGATLVAGLRSDVVFLGGPETSSFEPGVRATGSVPVEVYRRLASDLQSNRVPVVVDLCGPALDAALEAGVDVLKVSDEELAFTGLIDGAPAEPERLVPVIEQLAARGAGSVIVTRADRPIVALIDGAMYEVRTPVTEAIDVRGGGDAVTAGTVAGMARGYDRADCVRLGAAAGALNVTRRGLASGSRREIEELASHVEVRPL